MRISHESTLITIQTTKGVRHVRGYRLRLDKPFDTLQLYVTPCMTIGGEPSHTDWVVTEASTGLRIDSVDWYYGSKQAAAEVALMVLEHNGPDKVWEQILASREGV